MLINDAIKSVRAVTKLEHVISTNTVTAVRQRLQLQYISENRTEPSSKKAKLVEERRSISSSGRSLFHFIDPRAPGGN
jgi:hypothetical protein